ncbi:MAG: hypothetical protein A2174_02640 [Candidatus Portnoybacteria bacterium RBG_13_41_18]|uniref:riboflavin kinase n=1 Tax=Candidatus Portnoybacteria bacterium RBG_13_41_18 TaxID=1801991 RepID=A0A1G2F9E9_9BACT|nr:MAG: hypothetical protein A2174_02640 [Candidatus Portnoybacteria bacterium RBG_13_41_18]
MYISGKVIGGNRRGGKLGFPTANIELKEKLESGVSAGEVEVNGKKYKAAIFIGKEGKILEAHIIGFEGDLYGKEIKVKIIKKIRNVWKFRSDKELKRQIGEDIKIIKKISLNLSFLKRGKN